MPKNTTGDVADVLKIKRVGKGITKGNKLIYNILTGLELEIEGIIPDYAHAIDHGAWSLKGDGSLRNGGLEYVLSTPWGGLQLEECIQCLNEHIKEVEKKQGLKSAFNWRTSLHVHLNFSDKSMLQLYSFIATYLVFERLLMKYCGVIREENIYCVPVYKSKPLKEYIRNFLFKHQFSFTEEHKYCAINLACLRTFGSVELRMRGGTFDAEEIIEWLNILYSIVSYSEELINSKELHDLPSIISSVGFSTFGKNCFKDQWKALIKGMNKGEVERDILRGIRTAQDFIYSESNPYIKEI